SEMKIFADWGAPMSEEEIHFLFDMALKGANDIPRAQDPRLVLEVLLLRMAAAPRILDLQSLLGSSSQPAPQPRGELRPPEGRKNAVRPIDVQKELKSAVEKIAAEKPAPAPVVPEKPKKPAVSEGKTPQERWLHFVELVREQDAFFAAKIE